MEKSRYTFKLEFNSGEINVSRHSFGKQDIFRITFPDNRFPLVITRASHSTAERFWTSVPEGRQKEAEEVGALISEYFKSIE